MSNDADKPHQEPLRIDGPEQGQVNLEFPDGGLAPAVGVHNYQVFRANGGRPELADGKGYTYNHHVDMACWKGLLYVAWNSCLKDEDIWPSRELYSSSVDGAHWSQPRELFPQGVSMPLRMYFYHSSNGRMLVIGGLRTVKGPISEMDKGSLVVRQIRVNHTLGPIATLRAPAKAPADGLPTHYTRSKHEGFIEACNELLADRAFLEQQDYGILLGPRRMKWHEASSWPDGKLAWANNPFWVFGKGMALFCRKDGALVGISKMGFVTVSEDEGQTWSQPVVPPSFGVGSAKTWPRETSDGRYSLVYNPSKTTRFPLIVVSGDDGVAFRDMRVVHGELPIMRYEGAKSVGPQYVRGISRWSSDGTWKDDALWIVYSVNKEDIWVARISVPVQAAASKPINGDFSSMAAGPIVPGWNTYSPAWAPVSIVDPPEGGGKCLRLEDRDPYDYARAICLFPQAGKVTVSFDVIPGQAEEGTLEIELLGSSGHLRPVRVVFGDDGKVKAADGPRTVELAPYSANRRVAVKLDADSAAGRYAVSLDGKCLLKEAAFADAVDSLQQLSFRTGPYRAIGKAEWIKPETDCPLKRAVFDIRNVAIVP